MVIIVGDEYVYDTVCGMVSGICTYLQACPIVYNKYVQAFVCQSHLNKVIFKKHLCPAQSVT